jgi:MFS family permease
MTESSTVNTDARGPEPKSRYPRKLGWTLGLAAAGVYTMGTGASVLAGLQLENFDPANKQANLAIVAALGSLVSLLATPVWGAVSDRTRSRFGRRAPIALIGGVLAAVALIGMAFSATVVALAIWFCVVELFFAAINASLAAVIPDRVPAAVRGVVSSILGFGIMIGITLGQVVGPTVAATSIPLAYLVFGIIILIGLVIFLLANPDLPSRDSERQPFAPIAFVRSFWVNPRRYPDFAWVFWARGFMFLGYTAVNAYGFYILQDYIGLSEKKALATVPELAIVSLVGIAISILLSGWLSDRIGRRKPFVIASSLISAVGVCVPFFIPSLNGMLAYAFITGLGYGCYLSIDNALITQVLPPTGSAAKDLGVASIGGAVAQVLAPAIAGLIVVSTGHYQPLFLIAAGVSIVGALCILPIKSVR